MTKVLFFGKGDETVASSRFRCFYFADALRREGFRVRICQPPPRSFGRRAPLATLREAWRLVRWLASVERDEIVYLQRPTANTLFVAVVAADKLLRRRTLVFDFCDPIFVHSPRKTGLLTRLADAVVVSSADLADYARRHNGSVHTIPNSLPDELIPRQAAPRRADGRTVIGWVGYALGHAANLRLLLPVLSRLPAGVTLRMVGMKGADELAAELRALTNLRVELVDWLPPEKILSEVEGFDVCLLPLEDTVWNRKLNTKLLEYMALGRAVVASPVGENRRIVRDGENGFLAADGAQWLDRLERLIADPELRDRMGGAALSTVREGFALSVNGPRLAAVLAELRSRA